MKNEKREWIIKVIVAFAIPTVLLLFFCVLKGVSFADIFIPGARKNDCLFYYKVVESIIQYGMPRGYFGYNETHALVGSLPTWSPVTYLPWIIWGKMFGWNDLSAVICNLFFFSLSIAVFVFLLRPKWINIIAFFIFCVIFTSIPFYLMNLQPEILIVSFLIIFYAFAFCAGKTENNLFFVLAMLILTFFLTLIRPYFILLLGLPAYWLIKDKRRFRFLIILGILTGSLLGYFLCTHYFTSEYLVASFDVDLIEKIITFQIVDVLDMVFQIIQFFFGDLKNVLIVYGLKNTSAEQYFVVLLLVIMVSLFLLDNKNKVNRVVNGFYVISTVLLFITITLFRHSSLEGGRYLFAFAVAGCLIVAFNDYSKVVLVSFLSLAAFFVALISMGSLSPIDITIPTDYNNLSVDIEYWQDTFKNNPIFDEKSFGYENTVDWVYDDIVGEESVKTRYGELFSLPAGMGINCCTGDFIMENFTDLKSRYIAAPNGGEIDKKCFIAGWNEVGRTENVVVYRQDK